MRVGDIVICKADFVAGGNNNYYFGNTYYINKVDKAGCYISKFTPEKVSQKTKPGWYGRWFYKNSVFHDDDIFFKDYFYTLKEFRRLKLKNL